MKLLSFESNGQLAVVAICPDDGPARVSLAGIEFTRAEAARLAKDIRDAEAAVERHNRPRRKWGEL